MMFCLVLPTLSSLMGPFQCCRFLFDLLPASLGICVVFGQDVVDVVVSISACLLCFFNRALYISQSFGSFDLLVRHCH